jgi:hypothetical protein
VNFRRQIRQRPYCLSKILHNSAEEIASDALIVSGTLNNPEGWPVEFVGFDKDQKVVTRNNDYTTQSDGTFQPTPRPSPTPSESAQRELTLADLGKGTPPDHFKLEGFLTKKGRKSDLGFSGRKTLPTRYSFGMGRTK